MLSVVMLFGSYLSMGRSGFTSTVAFNLMGAFLVLSLPMNVTAQETAVETATAQSGDPAEMVLRLNRLESMIRQLSGQMEELQFQNSKLQERLNKAEQKSASERSETSRAADQPVIPAKPQKTADVFDPNLDPNAPGAPKPLGTLTAATETSAQPAGAAPGGPIDLLAAANPDLAAGESETKSTLPQGALTATDGVAATLETSTRTGNDDFDTGKALYKSGEFERAASALRLFVAAKPEDKRIAEATFMIGASEFQQRRYTESAKNYLKIIQFYPKSTLAPQSLVQLGSSLMGMGQKLQACATLSELSKRYPDAATSVVAMAEKERKAGGC
ncbi:MAG: tetratricopeptide repeat protein [Hyphomicrobiales bacterium]